MRDPKRIKKFCDELAEIWETKCPDWRFGQLMVNVFRGTDPFYMEEDKMLKTIKKCFNIDITCQSHNIKESPKEKFVQTKNPVWGDRYFDWCKLEDDGTLTFGEERGREGGTTFSADSYKKLEDYFDDLEDRLAYWEKEDNNFYKEILDMTGRYGVTLEGMREKMCEKKKSIEDKLNRMLDDNCKILMYKSAAYENKDMVELLKEYERYVKLEGKR